MVNYFTEENSAETVIERLKDTPDPRLKEIMTAAIRHLHAFVKEVEPTLEEWMQAIQWLTRVGQISDDKRQEWILASDTLGVSMLVETINHRSIEGATEATVLGPFFVPGSPDLPMGADICLDKKGERCLCEGVVTDQRGRPLEGAVLDVWMGNAEGFYAVQQPGVQDEMNLRGRFTTGPDGKYWFWTTKPVPYPIPTDGPVGDMLRATDRQPYRPAHVHFMVSAPGYETLTTHVFPEGDPFLDKDPVFGVKESLVIPFPKTGDHVHAVYDFALKPDVAVKAAAAAE